MRAVRVRKQEKILKILKQCLLTTSIRNVLEKKGEFVFNMVQLIELL